MRAATPRPRSVIPLTALLLLVLGLAVGHSTVEAAEGVVTFSPAAPLVGKPITASLSDGDGSISNTTWQWSASGTRTGGFTDISGATSASFTPGVEHDGLYLRATATYNDSASNGNTAHAVTTARVNVEPPQFTKKTPTTVEVPENTTQVTVLEAKGASTLINYAVDGGADAAKFKVVTVIASNALVSRLVFKEAPDFDSPTDVESTTPANAAGNNQYVVRVRASYAAGLGDSTTRSTTRTIIVTVTDVDAPEQVAALTATAGYHEQKETFTVKAEWTAPSTPPRAGTRWSCSRAPTSCRSRGRAVPPPRQASGR